MWPAGSHHHGNNFLQTAAGCQGHRDTCMVDSGLPIPALGCHNNHQDTWTQVRVSDEIIEIWPIPESPDTLTSVYLSHVYPVLWSLQLMQRPVSGSHSSACPLQEQGWQVGNPQWPGKQRSHWRSNAPGTHIHWPVNWSQNGLWDPWVLHAHSAQKQTTYIHKQLYTHHAVYTVVFSIICPVTNYWSIFIDAFILFLVDQVLTFAASGSEVKCSWSTSVAVPADHTGATLTLTPIGVAHCAEGALRITLAFWEMEFNTEYTPVKQQYLIKYSL